MKTTNALVTYTDLSTMSLIAKGTPATGARIATKQFIINNYVVNESASPFSTYTPLRCPPYQTIVPVTPIGKAIGVAGQNGSTGTPYGIYNSIDYGLNWSVLKSLTVDTLNIQSVAASSNFQYITFGGYTGLSGYDTFYRSSNYGATWTSSFINNIIDVSMSDNGQYQLAAVAGASGTIYASTNYGSTWAQVSGLFNDDYKAVAISSTGQYQTFISTTKIYISSNYGASFSSTSVSYAAAYLSMSKDGKYQYISGLTKVFRSVNYGASFAEITAIGTAAWGDSAISYDGKYVLIVNQGISVGNSNSILLSSNYGVGFTTISGIPNNSDIITPSISPDGKYMLCGGYSFPGGTTYANNVIIRSTDNGSSFSVVSNTNVGWKSIYMGEPSYTPIYYYYRYDLDAYCNAFNATLYYSYNVYPNGYYNIGGTVYELTAEPAAATTLQIVSATPAICPAGGYILDYNFNQSAESGRFYIMINSVIVVDVNFTYSGMLTVSPSDSITVSVQAGAQDTLTAQACLQVYDGSIIYDNCNEGVPFATESFAGFYLTTNGTIYATSYEY